MKRMQRSGFTVVFLLSLTCIGCGSAEEFASQDMAGTNGSMETEVVLSGISSEVQQEEMMMDLMPEELNTLPRHLSTMRDIVPQDDASIPDEVRERIENAAPEDRNAVRSQIQKEQLDMLQMISAETMTEMFETSGMSEAKDRILHQRARKGADFENDPFGALSVAGKQGDVTISTNTTWSSYYGTCPVDNIFNSLTVTSNATLSIKGCTIYVYNNINVGPGYLDARSDSLNGRTSIYTAGSIVMYNTTCSYPAVLQTGMTDIYVNGSIWLWACAKWEAGYGTSDTTTVQPYTPGAYWSGVAVWGNYFYGPDPFEARLYLKNTELRNAIYAVNASIWDSTNSVWAPVKADIYMNNVDIYDSIAGFTAHNMRDSSLTTTSYHYLNDVDFINTDETWFSNVYDIYGWDPPDRPWWAFGIEDTQSSVSYNYIYYANDNASDIDWLSVPIFKRRCADITYVSYNSIYRRSTNTANHLLMEDLRAKVKVNYNTFVDATVSTGNDERKHSIDLTVKNHLGTNLSTAIEIYNNNLGSLTGYKYNGANGISVMLDGQTTPLQDFSLKIHDNNIYNHFMVPQCDGLIYVYGRPVMDSGWVDVSVYSNKLYNKANYANGIAVFEGDDVRIYDNQFESFNKLTPLGSYKNGIEVAENLDVELYNNDFNGALYAPSDGSWDSAWLKFAAGSDDFDIWVYDGNNDWDAENHQLPYPTYSVMYRSSYFCPISDFTIGYNRNNVCMNNYLTSSYAEDCPASFDVLECQ